MKISVDENRDIILRQVFLAVGLITEDGEEFSICMRDTGFEFQYAGIRYEAKEGELKQMGQGESKQIDGGLNSNNQS